MDMRALLAGVPSSMRIDPWLQGAVGAVAVAAALWSIRTGEARLSYRRFQRHEEPAGFWMAVAALGGLGVVLVAASLLHHRK